MEAVLSEEKGGEVDGYDGFFSRAINGTIVPGSGTVAVPKLLTIDHDYWQGWSLYEVLRYAPEHNWIAYEQALKTNPVLAKMAISGIVYSIGDWIARCYEGKLLFDFDLQRMFRSGLVGFICHGSLSHYYYQFCEAGWKLWPFAHLITYGVVPVEQRLLWVDFVELIWVTIISMGWKGGGLWCPLHSRIGVSISYSNENSEARISEATSEANPKSLSSSHEE